MTNDAALSPAFDRALTLAHDFHRSDRRKGTRIPYISHLLQVAGLVLEANGTETQAIAALLHDAIEDADTAEAARARRRRIEQEFGAEVLALVEACTDGDPDEKREMSWTARKTRSMEHLATAPEAALLVSVSDKLHNARAILRDYRDHSESLWGRFSGGKSGSLWYYRQLVNVYRDRGFTTYVDELDDVVAEIERHAVYGSRQHMLDWVESDDFLGDLRAMVRDLDVEVPADAAWWPRGWLDPHEVKLDRATADALDGLFDAEKLEQWWLAKPGAASVPNWDGVVTCRIDGRPGLILIEAKAHAAELESAGKSAPSDSAGSRANHERIGQAIEEARAALESEVPGIAISRDRAYQLSNRIAYAWWLAREGVPTVVLYLGFLDSERHERPLRSDQDWRVAFAEHADPALPASGLERWIPASGSRFAVAVRSMPAPPDRRRRPRDWPRVS